MKEGKLVRKFKIAYAKRTKKFTAFKVKKPKSYNYMRHILKNVYFRAVAKNRCSVDDRIDMKRKLFVTPEERPERAAIIEQSTKYSRLK